MHKKMQALMDALDLDKNGFLTFSEFMIIASQPEVALWLESLDLETDDLLTLFMLIDRDGDGRLTLKELLHSILRLRGSARGIDLIALRRGVPCYLLQEDDPEQADEQ